MIPATLRLGFCAGFALLASACDRPAGDPAEPDSYAVTLPVEPAGGGGVQRLSVPAQALIAVQRRDLGDLRIFDADGRAMPVARIDALRDTATTRLPLPLYEIVGRRDALRVTGVSLRIEGESRARIVGVDGTVENAGGAAEPIGVLLDTRAITVPLSALEIGAVLPAGQSATFLFETGKDLRQWESLGERTLFQPAGGAATLGDARLTLDGTVLKDRYVRVSWSGPAGTRITGAAALAVQAASPRPETVDATGAERVEPHEVRFTVPFAAPVEAVRVRLGGNEGVVPVALQARADREAPWQPPARATLRREAGMAGTLLDTASLGDLRQFRIEADARTPGFAAPPHLQLLLEPVTLAVRFEGTPPYRLASGLASAPLAYLTGAEIAPGGRQEALATLPQAGVTIAPAVSVRVSPREAEQGIPPSRLVLWAILALGTLVLGYAAIRLLRDKPAEA